MSTPGSGRFGTALVTGASRGLGRAVALRLASDGTAVAVNYRAAADEAQRVVAEIRDLGVDAVALQADIADPDAARALFSRAQDVLGPISIVISNAGITRDRLLIQMSEDDWAATWCTDLVGARALCREAVRCMNHGGRIVTVSSVVAVTGNAGQANYAASKAAVEGLTRELAVEAAEKGITVNCIIPGYIPTDATAHLTDRQREVWFERIPMGRGGTPSDIAGLAAYLVSPQAGYITGQCIAVDGGLLAQAWVGMAP